MASEITADKLSPSTGTSLQLGDASDTVTIPTGATFTVTDGLSVASGATGLTSFTAGDVLYATGSTTLAKLAKGTGLQGLQTNSGATAPQWSDSPQSLMTAAGDIFYASGANTLAKLAKGSDDEVLTLASGVPSWAASAAGGKIGQIVSDIDTTKLTTTSTTQVTTGIAVTITPAATTSKVYLVANMGCFSNNTYPTRTFFTIVGGNAATYIGDAGGSPAAHRVSSCACVERYLYSQCASQINYLDSPATTSATTYTLYYWSDSGTTVLNSAFTTNADSGNTASSLTAMEVLA
jgi:hypothetical protein